MIIANSALRAFSYPTRAHGIIVKYIFFSLVVKFENAALFLFFFFRSTVHTNPSRKRSFLKTLFKPEEFENACFAFQCGRKTFSKGAFRKRWRHGNHVASLHEFSSNSNPKWPVIVAFSNFSGVVWTGPERVLQMFFNTVFFLCNLTWVTTILESIFNHLIVSSLHP